ncbi:MAG: hypothetical protein AAF098_08485 [Pseudomonadota bacterium]
MRHFEFWPPRLFEAPYYLALLALCVRHRLPLQYLAKANYALDHGELALGSKYETQMAFAQDRFPATLRLDPSTASLTDAQNFAAQHGFPLIIKPEIGSVGKGVGKVKNFEQLQEFIESLRSPHLLQAFVEYPCEFGVFYVRKRGAGAITGINQKHFPEVKGNGVDTLHTLAERHERFSKHWPMFLKDHDLTRVPEAGERVRLSYIGSHTMGCKFTNDSELASAKLLAVLEEVCTSQPGFNFGRLDVRSPSREALQEGEFVIIEVNGVASLPTHMFDPKHSLPEGYRIFLTHARHLVEVAAEHRDRPMPLLPLLELLRKARRNARELDALQAAAIH